MAVTMQIMSTTAVLTQDGWGIATDGASLIISDSGPTLYWLDAKTLQEQRRVDVHDGTRKVPWVNEVRSCSWNMLSVILLITTKPCSVRRPASDRDVP